MKVLCHGGDYPANRLKKAATPPFSRAAEEWFGQGGAGPAADYAAAEPAHALALAGADVDGDAGSDAEADGSADFLLLHRTGNGDLGFELRELFDRQANRFHCLPFPLFWEGGFCHQDVEISLIIRAAFIDLK
ncbi:MAG TPA: hypothetical protein VGX37_02195 [Allosphingosinicella sp.]|jgi:hypothetical protein|nr:hypothetical protein [Allosphingosinicella sp.]